MDPITQGAFGASWALSTQKKTSQKTQIQRAFLLGWISGMAADLDVLIRSNTDHLLSLEYHRQFTHSLIFIPLGALICCFLLSKFFGIFEKFPPAQSFKRDYLICFAAFASHGVLDAATSYGTQLFWPFTNYRVSWDIISIIDPIFTSLLIIGIILTRIKIKVSLMRIFLGAAFLYLGFGLIQRTRVLKQAEKIAIERNHRIENLTVKPSFGNLLVWKSIYSSANIYYVDAIRAGFSTKVYPGDSTKKYTLEEAQTLVADLPIQKNDVKRFHWFSQGYISIDKQDPNYLIDVRYSMLPNEVRPLWGIALTPGSDGHADFVQTRGGVNKIKKDFLYMLKGEELM